MQGKHFAIYTKQGSCKVEAVFFTWEGLDVRLRPLTLHEPNDQKHLQKLGRGPNRYESDSNYSIQATFQNWQASKQFGNTDDWKLTKCQSTSL